MMIKTGGDKFYDEFYYVYMDLIAFILRLF